MFTNKAYNIATTASFNPGDFPILERAIIEVISQLSSDPPQKAEMVLSFVMHHRISSELVRLQPMLAEKISAGPLPLKEIEAVFQAANKNLPFTLQLQQYIKDRFATHNTKN